MDGLSAWTLTSALVSASVVFVCTWPFILASAKADNKGRATPSAFAVRCCKWFAPVNSFVVATPSAALRPVLKNSNASRHSDALDVARPEGFCSFEWSFALGESRDGKRVARSQFLWFACDSDIWNLV